MKITKNILSSGNLGVKIRKFPYGATDVAAAPCRTKDIESDNSHLGGSTTGAGDWLTLRDESNRLQWSYMFYEHLDMELSSDPSTRDHLRTSMEL